MPIRLCRVCGSRTGEGLEVEKICCSPLCVDVWDEWRKASHVDARTLYDLYMERKYRSKS